MILVGTYHHQIDENGRFRVPVKFKKPLGIKDKKDKKSETAAIEEEEKFPFIMKGTNKCLFVYPADVAEKLFFGSFGDCSFTSEEDSDEMRGYTANAAWGEPDAQGRIALSPELIAAAELDKDIVSVGVYNHIEIWSEKNWKEYLEARSKKDKPQAKE